MTSFLKSALLAITAGFLGLTICTQVRSQDQSQDRLNLNEPIALEFQSFFKMPIGPKGLEVSEKVLNASGKKVRLTGYMVQHEISPLGAFILAPRPVQMSEHADGDANDLPASICWIILDETQKNLSVPHIPGKIIVEGLFSYQKITAPDGTVAWFHLQLAADAVSTAHANAPDHAPSVHMSHHHKH